MHRDVPCNLDELVPPRERLAALILGMGSRKCPYLGEIGEVFYCSARFDPEEYKERELCRELERRVLSIEVLEKKCFGNYTQCEKYNRQKRLEELFGI